MTEENFPELSEAHLLFYAAIGRVITQWAEVVRCLSQVFVVSAGRTAGAVDAFYALRADEDRLLATDAAVRATLQQKAPDALPRWSALHARINNDKRRNKIAHWSIWLEHPGQDPETQGLSRKNPDNFPDSILWLGESHLGHGRPEARTMQSFHAKRITTTDILETANDLSSLKLDLNAFANELPGLLNADQRARR